MKKFSSEEILGGLRNIVSRFPLSLAFIIALTAWRLYEDSFSIFDDSISFILLTGIFLSAASQLLYESLYDDKPKMRWILYGITAALVLLYYFFISASLSQIDTNWYFYSIPGIRTMILYFVVLILFIWMPSFKSKIKFSESFLVTFKAFFIALFFSAILFIGVAATISLFELLIFSIETDWYTYASIFIFNLFAPILFFAFIPEYHQMEDSEPEVGRPTVQAIAMPKFLHHLISFILIPIMGILTIIIIAYIIGNLTDDFFQESLIEGLLLTYTIYGWILLLLADTVANKIAQWFRQVFPFTLIFVIILQMISTFLQIQEVGVTHGRYLIILFGIGSVISAGYYIAKKQNIQLLPLVAMIAGLIALVPPLDAMSVSVRSQQNRLYEVFENNEMLVDEDTVTKNPNVSEEEQEIVRVTLNYLSEISALNQLSWLPREYYYREDQFLGFVDEREPTDGDQPPYRDNFTYTYVFLEETGFAFDLANFSHLAKIQADSNGTFGTVGRFEKDGVAHTYEVLLDNGFEIYLTSEQLDDSLRFDFTYILEQFEGEDLYEVPIEDVTFDLEVDGYQMKIIIEQIQISGDDSFLVFYLFI